MTAVSVIAAVFVLAWLSVVALVGSRLWRRRRDSRHPTLTALHRLGEVQERRDRQDR